MAPSRSHRQRRSPLTAKKRFERPAKGWIDAHVHVWTPDIDRYPLDAKFDVSDMQPPSFTPEQLFKHCRPSGVGRIVLIQMSFYNFDNRYMVDMIAKHPGVFSGVGIVDHHASDVAAQMKDAGLQGVRGFRLHSRGKAASWPDDEGMATLWKTARREENLAVCPLINPRDIPFVDALCKKFPGTKVVVDHFARVGITGKHRFQANLIPYVDSPVFLTCMSRRRRSTLWAEKSRLTPTWGR